MKIGTEKLFDLQKGMIFYEEDQLSMLIFCGISFSGDDILVKLLNWEGVDGSDGERRLGIREMDSCERKSTFWIVPEEDELIHILKNTEISLEIFRCFKFVKLDS
jgi:hypothetical protein